MPTPPSAHAARAGAWALLVVLATDLVLEVTRRVVGQLGPDPDAWSRSGLEWYHWLEWLHHVDLPLRALLTALAVVALLRLRRGSADAGARAMFLGSGLLMALAVGMDLLFRWMLVSDAQTAVARGGAFVRLAVVSDRLAVASLLAALWRARRAWGLGVGAAWSVAAALYGLRVALIVRVAVAGPSQVDHAAMSPRWLMMLAIFVADVGALMATLIAFARVAPAQPAAERCLAAASGLDLYFRALVTRVTVLVVGVVVTLAFGLTSPATRGRLLFAVLVLALPAVVVQLAGLTRYADAPLKLGRGALGVALVGMGVGLAVEALALVLYAELLWPGLSTGGFGSRADSLSYAAALQVAGAGGQCVALVTAVALLLSLRRAALGLDAPALAGRAAALATALVGVAAGAFALLRLLGGTLLRAPIALFGLGLAALVVGVTVFVRWLRLVEGVAQELRARAKLE